MSSQATKSVAANASRTRSVISPRFPIGVAARYRPVSKGTASKICPLIANCLMGFPFMVPKNNLKGPASKKHSVLTGLRLTEDPYQFEFQITNQCRRASLLAGASQRLNAYKMGVRREMEFFVSSLASLLVCAVEQGFDCRYLLLSKSPAIDRTKWHCSHHFRDNRRQNRCLDLR